MSVTIAQPVSENESDSARPGASQPGAPKYGKVARLGAKGGLAIVDQALISGSNFLISILLGRWLSQSEYGAFALAFSVFLLLSFLYHSLLLEPMAVFSGSTYRGSLRGYLKSLLWIHLALTVAGCVFLGGAALWAWRAGAGAGVPGALAGVMIAAPCILLFWLVRRAFYMELAPARATVGAFIYCVLVTGGLYVAYKKALISPFSAYLLMALGAVGTSVFLLLQIRATLKPDRENPPTPGEAWRKHWEYGRWALAVAVVTWIPYYMYYPVVTTFSGIAQAGQLRALMNFSLPMEQAYTALSLLFLPYAARINREQGPSSAGTLVRKITLLFIGGAVAYWAVVLPLRGLIFRVLYGGKYIEVSHLLPFVALGTTMWAAAFGPAIVLRAMEAPNTLFRARVVASALSLLIGVPATKWFGLWGVVTSIIIANFAAFVISLYLLRQKSQQPFVATPVLQGEG